MSSGWGGGYEKGKWGIYWNRVYTRMKLSKENRGKRNSHFKEWTHATKLCEDQWTVERTGTFPSFQDGETHNVTTWTEQLWLQARFLYHHSEMFHKLPNTEFLQLSGPIPLLSHCEDPASDKTHLTIRVTSDVHISPNISWTPEHPDIILPVHLQLEFSLSWANHLSLVLTSPRHHKYL